ncbi:MAG: glycosyltransferase [Sphingobacteriales bacterium JAD_PAG50586_3]|nr:MAG: glycosyltransferase [Sphingobacteriales bacterium JAD_PAG50586_3]
MDSPSTRYRGKYFLDALKTGQNITYSFVYPSYALGNIAWFIYVYVEALLFRRQNSIIIFQKIYTNRIYSKALKLLLLFRKENTIYDIDDAEYERFPDEVLNHFIKYVSRCTVGSDTLMAYAKRINPLVDKLPSAVIPHNHIKQSKNDVFTIGWIGFYNAHRQSLMELFYPAIATIQQPIKLVLLGVDNPLHIAEITAFFADNPNIEVVIPADIDWQDEQQVYKRIKDFDVGIAPLINNEMNRSKSAFKLKQYLSCGVPALASSIGENVHYITKGENGFYCNSPDEYRQRIDELMALSKAEYARLIENSLASTTPFTMDSYCADFMRYCK